MAKLTRDEAVAAIVATGKTPEQANAFLDLLGSAFARRGWISGEPLGADEVAERFDTFVGASTVEYIDEDIPGIGRVVGVIDRDPRYRIDLSPPQDAVDPS